jgi:hypothetical protein
VDYWSYAYLSDPIVHGFIEQSGTAAVSDFSPYDNTAQWFTVSSILGCGGSEAGIIATAFCLQTRSWQSISAAAAALAFSPTIDEKLIFSDYTARAASGLFVRKPYLIGNNDYEIGNYQVFIPFTPGLAEVANLLGFNCPARDATKYRSDAGVPVWRYRWFGVFPNTILTYNPPSGAWHGSEVTAVFGTNEQVTGTCNTPPEQAITAYLMGAWSTFAKNPSTGLSSSPYGWPVYSPSSKYNNPRLIFTRTYDDLYI